MAVSGEMQGRINALVNPDPVSIKKDFEKMGEGIVDLTRSTLQSAWNLVPGSEDSLNEAAGKVLAIATGGALACYTLPTVVSSAASHVANHAGKYAFGLAAGAAGKMASVQYRKAERERVISDRNAVAKPLLEALGKKEALKKKGKNDAANAQDAKIATNAEILVSDLTKKASEEGFAFSKALFNQTLSLLKTHYSTREAQTIFAASITNMREVSGWINLDSVKFSEVSGDFESIMKEKLLPILAKKLIKEKKDDGKVFSSELIKEMTKEIALSFSNGAPVEAEDADKAFKVLMRELLGVNSGDNFLSEIQAKITSLQVTIEANRDPKKLMKAAVEENRTGDFADFVAEKEVVATAALGELEELQATLTIGKKVTSEINADTDIADITLEAREEKTEQEESLSKELSELAGASDIGLAAEVTPAFDGVESISSRKAALEVLKEYVPEEGYAEGAAEIPSQKYQRALSLVQNNEDRDRGLYFQVYVQANAAGKNVSDVDDLPFGEHSLKNLVFDEEEPSYDGDLFGYVSSAIDTVISNLG